MKFHCFFEQSGTFKNEIKKLGYEAYDYDILNDYGETDFQIDLFAEIQKAYIGEASVFDNIKTEDWILSFFPCTRFEDQMVINYKGLASQMKKWTIQQKLMKSLEYHEELSMMYETVTKMALVVYNKNLKMIFENPAGNQHYLNRYWPLEPAIKDNNRRNRGDYFIKPTQYWFINCKPSNNLIFEPMFYNPDFRKVQNCSQKIKSEISPEYANRFIREFVLPKEEENG